MPGITTMAKTNNKPATNDERKVATTSATGKILSANVAIQGEASS